MQNGSSENEERQSWNEDYARSIVELFPNAKKAHEAGLAVLAAGGVYWVYPYEDQYALVVPSRDVIRFKEEVSIYQNQNRFWPVVSPELAEKQIDLLPTCAFLFFLSCIYYLQGAYPNLEEKGMNSSSAFRESFAWWRVVTATTLHADLGHLVGNLFGLGLFGYFSARYLGNGLAWLIIFLTAACSNLTNVFIHWDQSFLSLGASTAVFSALGVVTGFPIGSVLKTERRLDKRQWLIPLTGGLMLLGWMGSGNYLTDVAGHLWSFIYGLAAGVIISRQKLHAQFQKGGQGALLALCWLMIAISWLIALTTHVQ